MKVFISWSGRQSKAVAAALHEWIPYVINEAEPFMSADSIESGQRWSAVLASELEKTNFGIVCTSASNQQEPWLNFEAGALAKSIGEARVVPLAIDLKVTEIRQPLGQFNAVAMDQGGVTKMMHSLNAVAEKKIEAARLDQAIGKWWPDLETKLSAIPPDAARSVPKRDDSEVLLEVLETVRGLARNLPLPSLYERGPNIGNYLRPGYLADGVAAPTWGRLNQEFRRDTGLGLQEASHDVLQRWLNRRFRQGVEPVLIDASGLTNKELDELLDGEVIRPGDQDNNKPPKEAGDDANGSKPKPKGGKKS